MSVDEHSLEGKLKRMNTSAECLGMTHVASKTFLPVVRDLLLR